VSYATPDDLAQALGIDANASNTQLLQDCLDAASLEVDRILADDWIVPITDPVPSLVKRTEVNRAVEWYKAPATYNGGVGSGDAGTMVAPTSGFGRHAAVLYALTLTGASGVA
jgi:hypothetical protein